MMLNEIAILECPRIQLSFFHKLPHHGATNIVDLHGQFNNGLNNSLTTRKYSQGLSVCMSYINSFVHFLMPVMLGKHPDTFWHIRKHLERDRTSHEFQHLQHSEECLRLCSERCVSILDTAKNHFQFLLKEAAHIRRENPSLNRQLRHAEPALAF